MAKKKKKFQTELSAFLGLEDISKKESIQIQNKGAIEHAKEFAPKRNARQTIAPVRRTTININQTPASRILSGDSPFTMENIQKTQKARQEEAKQRQNIGSSSGDYILKKTGAGVTRGTIGIGQAVLTESASGMKQGQENKSASNILKNLFASNVLHGSTFATLDAITNLFKKDGKSAKEKAIDFGLDIAGSTTKSLNAYNQLVGMVSPKDSYKEVLKVNDKMSKPIDKMDKKLEKEAKKQSKATQTAGEVMDVVGNMLPSLAVSVATKNPNIGLATMGVSAKGTSTMEALKNGEDLERATKIGTAKGEIEVGTELLTGGLKGFGKGATDDVADKIVTKITNKVGNKGLTKTAKILNKGLNATKDIVGEIGEETIADILDTTIDKYTYNPEAKYSFEDWEKTAGITTASTIVLNTLTHGATRGLNKIGKINNQQMETLNVSDNSVKEAIKTAELKTGVKFNDKDINTIKDVVNEQLNKSSLTENEQNVVNDIVENRTAELKEKNGKVSNNDITNIRNEVTQRLKDGNLDVNEIERALSTDEWNRHNDAVKQKEIIENRLNDLKSKKMSDMTVDEYNNTNSEISSLQEQLDNIDTNTTREELNNSMMSKLSDNDTLLHKSFDTAYNFNEKFEQSAKAHNIDTNDDTIKTIKKKMLKRGISASFDEQTFSDSKEDAIWRQNEDGTREVIFNPKADTGMLLQNVAVHEMYHDVFSSKTGQKLNQEVLDYVKSKDGYEEARKELEQVYAKDYDINSEEFTKKIDEEVVAKTLGQKLGDQEYINSLTMEKPNTARAIYNWIVDKLNKFTGSKNEKLFWTDVKNKFETALSEDYVARDEAITKKHISKNLHKDIDKVLTDINERNPVRLRDYTPSVLVQNGVKDLPMYENPAHIRKNILTKEEAKELGLKINSKDNYHGLGKDLYIKVIDSLDNPRVIFKNKNDSNQFLILTMIKDSNKNNIIVPIEIETKTKVNNLLIDINRIKTVYGYDRTNPDLNKYIKDNINSNKLEKIYEYKKDSSTNITSQLNPFNNSNITQNQTNVNNGVVTKKSMQKSEKNTQEPDNGSFSLNKLPKVKDGYTRLYRGLNNDYDADYDRTTLDSPNGYDTLTDNYELAKQYGKNVYYIDIPTNQIADSVIDENPNSETYGDRNLAYKDDKPAGLNGVSGDEYLLYTDHDDFNSNNYHKVENINNSESAKYSISNKDSKGRTLTKEQQEYFKNSKIRNDNGELLEVYHGTNADFTVFDKSYLGSASGDSGFLGDGFYFATHSGEAGYYGGKNMKTYLNVTNPYNIKNLQNYKGMQLRGEGSNPYIEIKNLVDMNPEWKDIKVKYGNTYGDIANATDEILNSISVEDLGKTENGRQYKVNVGNSFDIVNTLNDYSIDELTADAFTKEMRNKFGFINSSDVIQNITDEVRMQKLNNEIPMKTFSEILEKQGYDGIIQGEKASDTDEIVVFNPNQIKNVDNTNPTTNEDIRKSTTTDKFQAFLDKHIERGTGKTIQEVTKQQEKAVKQAIAPLNKEIKSLKKEISDLQENASITQKEFEEQYKKIAPLLNEQVAPPEVERTPSIKDTSKMNKKDLKALSKNMKEQLGLTNKQKLDLEDIIQEYSTSETATRNDLFKDIKDRFGKESITTEFEDIKNIQNELKNTKLDVSQNIKNDITDYNKLKQRNFGKIRFNRDGLPVDVVYQELSSKYPNYFPANIFNESDQFNKIVEVANLENKSVEEYNIDDDYLREASDFIYDSIEESKQDILKKLSEKERTKHLKSLLKDNNIIAPIRENNSNRINIEKIKKNINEYRPYIEMSKELNKNQTNSEVTSLLNEVDSKNTNTENIKTKPRKQGMIADAKRTAQYWFTNRNAEIDEYARETGNKNIKILADHVNNIQGEITTNINNAQTDNFGNVIGKSITQIFDQARQEKKSDAFNDYLFHKSNMARHKQGKGSLVDFNESEQLVKAYEKDNPEFKKWAKEVNDYNTNLLYKQAEAGLITEDLADNLTKMYDFYVPFFEDVEKSYNPDNINLETKSTVKSARGGADRNLLGFEEAMMRQTQSAITQIRKNQLYNEIIKTKANRSMDFENNTDPNVDGTLQESGGKYYLTGYENGKATQVEIDKDLYHGLAQRGDKLIKQAEKKMRIVTKPLQVASNIRRNILTSWSPTFIITNPLKDLQDAPLNSKYAKDMAKNVPRAFKELTTGKGKELDVFLNMYGQANLRGDYNIDSGLADITKLAKTNKKASKSTDSISKKMLKKIPQMNEIIEMTPRYAEYLASIENGASQMEALYNAREVTTNFGRGGIITKALNRNGFTFLNASVQGFSKLVRNFSGENGGKAVLGCIAKASAFGLAPALINAILLGDDDDYEAIPDYIKDNYYLIKTSDDNFLRIPKGRMMSIFGSAGRRVLERTNGKRPELSLKEDVKGYLSNAYNQVGVQNPSESNIFAPIIQAKNNKTWYGTDLVPKRLQTDKDGREIPKSEQYDASTDKFSIWLGSKLGVSPYKINYVVDQYSGGIGDMILPTITEEAQSKSDSVIGKAIAPLKDKFTADSVTDNKNVTNFYSKVEELGKMPSKNLSKKDELSYQYLRNLSFEMGSLYKEMREVQSNTKMADSKKYAKVQNIKAEINKIAEEGMKGYKDVEAYENYARVGDRELYKWQNKKGETGWSLSDSKYADDINTLGLSVKEKNNYYTTKMKMSDVASQYGENDGSKRYRAVIKTIRKSGLPSDAKYQLFNSWYGKNDKSSSVAQDVGISADDYLKYKTADLSADKNKNGYSIRGSKANKVINFLNKKTNLNKGQKAILYRMSFGYKGNYYSTNYSNKYNSTIVKYVNTLDTTYDEDVNIYKTLGFKVDKKGNIWW